MGPKAAKKKPTSRTGKPSSRTSSKPSSQTRSKPNSPTRKKQGRSPTCVPYFKAIYFSLLPPYEAYTLGCNDKLTKTKADAPIDLIERKTAKLDPKKLKTMYLKVLGSTKELKSIGRVKSALGNSEFRANAKEGLANMKGRERGGTIQSSMVHTGFLL